MVAVSKNQPRRESKAPAAPKPPREAAPAAVDASTDSYIKERLARAKVTRTQAETARQKIINEIMEASKALYQKLVEEGADTLEKAKQLEAEAELRHLEAQRELEHSNSIRAEADAYRDKVIAQTQRQAQEMLRQAQTVKAEAITFREKLLSQVRQQAREELEQAQSERQDADAHRDKIVAEARRQAEDILTQARAAAEQEGTEIVQRYSVEAERILAEAEMVKAAVQEQLEAQKLNAELADLETEAKEVLEKARSQLGEALLPVEGLSPLEGVEDGEEEAGDDAALTDELPPPSTFEDDGEILQYERLLKLGYHGDQEDLLLPAAEEELSPDDADRTANSPTLQACREHLPENELVLGLEIDGQSKAYPLRAVTEARVINDSFNSQDVLITFGPPSELGMIFQRTVEDRTLTFQAISETANGLMLMQDRETGTIWEALTGRAISGPLVHAELHRLNYEYSFWFAWSDLHPQSEIYVPGPDTQTASRPG